MMNQAHWKSFFSDGLHLSPSGNAFLFNLLHPIFKTALGEKKDLTFDCPYWNTYFFFLITVLLQFLILTQFLIYAYITGLILKTQAKHLKNTLINLSKPFRFGHW